MPELVATDLILKKLKETQAALMTRQLKQRCYIERDGRMGLPIVSILFGDFDKIFSLQLMNQLQAQERA